MNNSPEKLAFAALLQKEAAANEALKIQPELIAALSRIRARLDGGTLAKLDPTGEVTAQMDAVLAKVNGETTAVISSTDPTISYDITEGQLVRYFHNRPEQAIPCDSVFAVVDALRDLLADCTSDVVPTPVVPSLKTVRDAFAVLAKAAQ